LGEGRMDGQGSEGNSFSRFPHRQLIQSGRRSGARSGATPARRQPGAVHVVLVAGRDRNLTRRSTSAGPVRGNARSVATRTGSPFFAGIPEKRPIGAFFMGQMPVQHAGPILCAATIVQMIGLVHGWRRKRWHGHWRPSIPAGAEDRLFSCLLWRKRRLLMAGSPLPVHGNEGSKVAKHPLAWRDPAPSRKPDAAPEHLSILGKPPRSSSSFSRVFPGLRRIQ